MSRQIRGLAAVEILGQSDVIKEFADSNNPIPIQILSRLVGVVLNDTDDFEIKKEYKESGETTGGAMLRTCLIQRYIDQPDNFTLEQFIDVLVHFNTNKKLSDLLCSKCNYVVPSQGEGPSIKDIKAYLQLTCKNVGKVWGKLLNETSLDKYYVAPEIKDGERRGKETGKSVSNYKELFDIHTLGDRIIIDGDPGMGKTTYVNKLALDWTWEEGSEHYCNETKFLQSKFTNIFLIPLRTLNGSRATTFAQAVSIQLDGCGTRLTSEYEARPSECLLILDAFDEYDGSCPEINKIIKGSLFPCLKVIITTRPSHVERLKAKNQWLSITGLTTKEKREQFLIKQGWDKPQERDMIINVLSNFGTLWHTPLYLAMLCVLYKAKKVTRFDSRNPNCFYVLVKLFTEHIISHKAREGQIEGPRLSNDQRLKIKSYIQKCAIQEFTKSNHWITDFFTMMTISSDTDGLKLAGQFGLLVIQEELSPVTGETVESVSFVHQLFLEYYAAVEFGSIFSSCTDKDGLVKLIKENLSLTDSPFSYFLAAECKEYKEILVKGQIKYCEKYVRYNESEHWDESTIYIGSFPWLPEILISNDVYNQYGQVGFCLNCHCSSYEKVKSFWDFAYVKELCSVAKPRKLDIHYAVLGYHDQSFDDILSMIDELRLWHCNCENINLDKQYPNLTNFHYSYTFYLRTEPTTYGLVMFGHFPNLHKLSLIRVNITNESINWLCDSLQNMNQLQKLELNGCFRSPQSVQHIIQLAETIESSSLCQSVKELKLSDNILDTETESSTAILLKAISKCVQLETLDLSYCQIESLHTIKEIIHNSPHLKKNLKRLDCFGLLFVTPHSGIKKDLDKGI